MSLKRILEISYKNKLAHIGSNLTTSPILSKIYNIKKKNDIVILSSGHAGLSQYVEIEKNSNNQINAENLLNNMGIHPNRDIKCGTYVSTGSLGCGILVAIGFAIADKNRDIYCILSDGECAEGSVWEALTFCKNMNLTNMRIYVNINGYSAYDSVDRDYLQKRLEVFCPWIIICQTKNPEYLKGLNSHYHIIKNEDEIEKILSSFDPI